jgi:hypothetical protein
MSIKDSQSIGPNPANPNQELFYELVSIATVHKHKHCIAKPDSLSTPIYYVERHKSLSKKKFDLKIHDGDSKQGIALGVVKLHSRGATIGLGDPDAVIEEGRKSGQRMIWEKLERLHKWNHNAYYFEYGSGEERKVYTYRKKFNRWCVFKSIELRLGGLEAVEGELVAKWVGTSKWLLKPGSLFIKREFGDQKSEVPAKETGKDWEMMVMLTMLTIIESQARRG